MILHRPAPWVAGRGCGPVQRPGRMARTVTTKEGHKDMNRAELIGNVGQAPEIRTTQAGRRVASFTLATNERWTDKASGEKREHTEWHRIVVWNEGLVGVVERFVTKGKQLFVAGQLRTRDWTDQQGVKRWTTEVVLGAFDGTIELLGSPGGGTRPPPADEYDGPGAGAAGTPAGDSGGAARSGGDDLDDDIPF
jgi:single-strand DNA-binding protein